MVNLNESATFVREGASVTDPATGVPAVGHTVEWANTPVAFGVLSAAEATQSWGDSDPTKANTVRASLIVPGWSPLSGSPSEYTVTVTGYPQTWRIESSRPGRDWTTYQLASI